MGILLKIVIFSTISAVIFAKVIDSKQVTGSKATGMPSEVTMLVSAFKEGLKFINPTPKQAPEKTVIRRVCKIKPNGDEECQNIPQE